MVAALPIIVGIQFILNAINYDIQNIPRIPLHLLSAISDAEGLRLPQSPRMSASDSSGTYDTVETVHHEQAG
jgi:hypothetical protein